MLAACDHGIAGPAEVLEEVAHPLPQGSASIVGAQGGTQAVHDFPYLGDPVASHRLVEPSCVDLIEELAAVGAAVVGPLRVHRAVGVSVVGAGLFEREPVLPGCHVEAEGRHPLPLVCAHPGVSVQDTVAAQAATDAQGTGGAQSDRPRRM